MAALLGDMHEGILVTDDIDPYSPLTNPYGSQNIGSGIEEDLLGISLRDLDKKTRFR